MRTFASRLGLIGIVVLGLLVAVLVVDGALLIGAGLAPNWLPYRMAGEGFQLDISQRVEAAEAAYRANEVPRNQYLCALIGLSGMREAGDLAQMTRAGQGRCRYIGLSGAGGQFAELALQTRRLVSGSLRPDVVVIGISEHLLVEAIPPVANADARSPWVQAFQRGDLWQTARLTKDFVWFIIRRDDVNGAVQHVLLDGKQKLLSAVGAETVALRNPMTDPWREMMRMGIPEHPSQSAMEGEIASYESRRLFLPASYAEAAVRPEMDALIGLVRDLRKRGSVVLIALMPQHSRLRMRLPAQGAEVLRNKLTEAFGPASLPILDLRSAVPDSGMADIVHVNSEGRRIVSAELALRIDDAIPTGSAPLMASR